LKISFSSPSNGYGKEVPVTFEVSPIIFDTIITDEEWLWQMLLNLLTNACKYTDRGSIHVKVSLTHEVKKSSEKTTTFADIRSSSKNTSTSVTAGMTVNTDSNYLLFEVADTGKP
jgi:signal transduction histidine kinase